MSAGVSAGVKGGMRVAALWFPDWPVQAFRLEQSATGAAGAVGGAGAATAASVTAATPVIIARQHAVLACCRVARAAGVRRGMRLRQAQALCPEAVVAEHNPERDGALFAGVVNALDAVASSIEVLRPGLVVVDAAAAARFHGGEDTAVEMLIDAALFDYLVGVADEIATAVIAARHAGRGAAVPAGGSARFLRNQSVQVLRAEPALGVAAELVDMFDRLGLRTLGEVAALDSAQVANRFGQQGARAHAIARAVADRRVAPELEHPELSVALRPEEPIERVDAAAFAARQLAAQLHARLVQAGKVCLRLKVVAELEGGETVERIWRTREALSESGTADRVRWQLDGWLAGARAASAGGIVGLELIPVEVAAPQARQLWGGGAGSDEDKVRQTIERVQSQLGMDRVLQPREAGGRGVAERVALVPYGEQDAAAAQGPWPGRIPAPLPARLGGGLNHPASRVQLADAAGAAVVVTAEALLSSTPYALRWGARIYRVAAWAGPWPVDAGWWGPEAVREARLQLVGHDAEKQRAWLLNWRGGAWRVEAVYS